MRLPLGAREDDEVRTSRIVLPVHPRRTQPEEPLDFGSLVVRVQIEVHPAAGPATVGKRERGVRPGPSTGLRTTQVPSGSSRGR